MTQKITIEPVTRIEGHAKVTIHIKDDGSVEHAYLHINEFRGFEKFCEGPSRRASVGSVLSVITSRLPRLLMNCRGVLRRVLLIYCVNSCTWDRSSRVMACISLNYLVLTSCWVSMLTLPFVT